MGVLLTPILLDTHSIYWWKIEPKRLSPNATEVIEAADELAVAAISWFELAWLIKRERIAVAMPGRSWLEQLAVDVATVGITPTIADTAAALPNSFPGDPADRLIYATAIERGWPLVTKDRRLRRHRGSARVTTVW